MKDFTLFLLIGLFIWPSYSDVGVGSYAFGVVGPFTASGFLCLKPNLPGVYFQATLIVRVYQNSHSPAGIDPHALQTLINANKVGYPANIYM